MCSKLKNGSILVLGQAFTSRTETVEDYLRFRCRNLATIALSGIRQRLWGRCSLYEKGKPIKVFHLPSFCVPRSSSLSKSFILFYFLLQPFLSLFYMLRLRTKSHFAIGISTFYAFMAILLKRLGFVNHVVYYSIDYYPQHTFMNRLFRALDKFCYENSDVVWNLSTAISETRHNRLGGNLKDQKNIIVPLTYSSKLLTFRPLEEIERQSIAFIGTLEKLQGLQLLIKAMPEVLTYLPNVIVKVIGDGPYAKELKELVSDSGLNEHFHFYGFVKKESDVIDVVSRCAVGVAPFIPVPENNALTADPGKPKFYAFCGLPIVITKIPSGLLIDKEGAGIAIEYDPHELANAVIRLLQDARLLARYRRNANRFAQSYTSERIFRDAFKTTLRCFQEQDLRYSQGGGYK